MLSQLSKASVTATIFACIGNGHVLQNNSAFIHTATTSGFLVVYCQN